jgi:hypothetical protein
VIPFFGTSTFTVIHVVISLVGIAAGIPLMAAMIGGRPLGVANMVFLVATVATTLTGFLFPFHGFDPAIGVGIVSTIALAVALLALYGGHLAGFWRPAYTVGVTLALYLNVFVGVVQSFQKIPFLQGADPNHQPPAFAVVQGAVLIGFIVIGVFATKRFHPVATA